MLEMFLLISVVLYRHTKIMIMGLGLNNVVSLIPDFSTVLYMYNFTTQSPLPNHSAIDKH